MGSKGNCIYVIEDNNIYNSKNSLGSKGECLFIVDGGLVYEYRNGSKGDCLLVFEDEINMLIIITILKETT